jgi:membrane protease YdiL (CAAX protease family)
MLGTWWLEGRAHTFLRPEAASARIGYAFGVNVAFSTGASGWLLRTYVRDGLLDAGRSGLRFGLKTVFWVVLGVVLGAGLFALQGVPTWDPVILINAFAQVFVVSAAEVLVCWVVVGNVARELLHRRTRTFAPIVGAAVASVLFGVYHFAHSPPFNTWGMVALLTIVGFLTSAFYFASRDLWGTIAFHNMLAVYGVVGALAEREALSAFETLDPALLGTAAVAACALGLMQYLVLRPMWTGPSTGEGAHSSGRPF